MTFQKKQNILSPELVVPKTDYAYTICPNDDFQHWNGEDRVKTFKRYAVNFILKSCPAKLDLWMEISRTGRLHWHGRINFPSYEHIRLFYIDYIHKFLKDNMVELDTIEDELKWSTYCSKGKNIINENIKSNDNLLIIANMKKPKYKKIPILPDDYKEQTDIREA